VKGGKERAYSKGVSLFFYFSEGVLMGQFRTTFPAAVVTSKRLQVREGKPSRWKFALNVFTDPEKEETNLMEFVTEKYQLQDLRVNVVYDVTVSFDMKTWTMTGDDNRPRAGVTLDVDYFEAVPHVNGKG
jgi:hypothetical protein